MHIVVNQFSLLNTANWMDLQSKVDQLQARLSSERPDFRGVSLVRVNDSRAIFVVLFKNLEALNDISKNIAAPWFAEHVLPHLDGAVDRQVGEVVAGNLK